MAIGLNLVRSRGSLGKSYRNRHRFSRSRTIATGVVAGLGLALLVTCRSGRGRAGPLTGGKLAGRAPALLRGPDGGPVAKVVRFSLLYVLPPIWLASSLADWACHRYSRIEETAGVKESLIHQLLLAELGLPVLGTVFLEITSPVVLMMVGAFLLHEATVYCDLRVAVSKRAVTPTEQMVHSFMEMMPLIGIWLVAVLQEDEVRALLGTSARSPDFSLRLKDHPLPISYRAGLITAIGLFGVIPYAEELWRTLRAPSDSLLNPRTRARRSADD